MKKFKPNPDLWDAFAGACRFNDKHPPLFAQVSLIDSPPGAGRERPDLGVAVLDQEWDQITLTINWGDEYGTAMSMPFPVGTTRDNALKVAGLICDSAHELSVRHFEAWGLRHG